MMEQAINTPGGTATPSVEMLHKETMHKRQYEQLTGVGCVSNVLRRSSFITMWNNGLHTVYFHPSLDGERITQGSMVSVTADYNEMHKRYSATSVTQLIYKASQLQPTLCSIGVIIFKKGNTGIIMDIATALPVRYGGNDIQGSVELLDVVQFIAFLNPDTTTQYKATVLCQSTLKNPQFGLVLKVPSSTNVGKIRTFINGSVVTATFTQEHSSCHMDKFQRVVFDAEIDPDAITLKVTSLEVLVVPSSRKINRQDAKGIVIQKSGNSGMIMDTTDFLGISFKEKNCDFPVTTGCIVSYSAILCEESSVVYNAEYVHGDKDSAGGDDPVALKYIYGYMEWEKEAVDHLKERLERHTRIHMDNLLSHWQQASPAVKNELKHEAALRKFFARHTSTFEVSKTDVITLCVKDEPEKLKKHENIATNESSEHETRNPDLEQNAVDYLVKCLNKHQVLMDKKLCGYLAQASREVQDLLNFNLDEFLQKYTCYFTVSTSGAISLRKVGEFDIDRDFRGSALGSGTVSQEVHVYSSKSSSSPQPTPGNMAEVVDTMPKANKWGTGKTVDKLFGTSAQFPQHMERASSKPVKLLSDCEIAARDFMVETLQKYTEIYLMNLHSHVQYAPEKVRYSLRGQDAQRQFLLKNRDLFSIDANDLITLKRKQVDAKPGAEDVNAAKDQTHSTLPVPVPEVSRDPAILSFVCEPSKDTVPASETSHEDLDWQTGSEMDEEESGEFSVTIHKDACSRNITLTKLEYEALQLIEPVFKQNGAMEKSTMGSYFEVHQFMSHHPDIFVEDEGYVKMAELSFSCTSSSTDPSRHSASLKEREILTQAKLKDEMAKSSSDTQCLERNELGQKERTAYCNVPMYAADENPKDEKFKVELKDTTKYQMEEPHGDLLHGASVDGSMTSEPTKQGSVCVGQVGHESSVLRRVTILHNSGPRDKFVTQLQYDALKDIASRFKEHGAIKKKNLFGHFGQSSAQVKAAYSGPSKATKIVSQFPDIFTEDKEYLKMVEIHFSRIPNSADQSLELRPVKRNAIPNVQPTKQDDARKHEVAVTMEPIESPSWAQELVYHESATQHIVQASVDASIDSNKEMAPCVHDSGDSSLPCKSPDHALSEQHARQEDHFDDILDNCTVTILDHPDARDIAVTQLQYDALKHIAGRFKKHGTILKKNLFGHFCQSDDHVKSAYFTYTAAASLVEMFPDIFFVDREKVTMAVLVFPTPKSSTDHSCPATVEVRDYMALQQSQQRGMTLNGKSSRPNDLSSSQLNEQSVQTGSSDQCNSAINDCERQESSSREHGLEAELMANVPDGDLPTEPVRQWEIEAKAFIASKLVKHTNIKLRNLHSVFSGAPQSLIQNLYGQDRQREFLLRHSNIFSMDKEDVISLVDANTSSTFAASGLSVLVGASSASTNPAMAAKVDGQRGHFVGVGQITNLYQLSGLVKDTLTDEIIHLKSKTVGVSNLLDHFNVDDFVSFQAVPREFVAKYPNAINKIALIDEVDAAAMKVFVEGLKNVESLSLQDLSAHLSKASEVIQSMLLPMETMEKFLTKHSMLFNQSFGSVSLKYNEMSMKPSSQKADTQWFKAIVRGQKGTREIHVTKSEFLALMHVRKALEQLGHKTEFNNLHELLLKSPGNEKYKVQTADQAREFVQKYPGIFAFDDQTDVVSMAKVTFTKRKEELLHTMKTGTVSTSSAVPRKYSSSNSSNHLTESTVENTAFSAPNLVDSGLHSMDSSLAPEKEALSFLTRILQQVKWINMHNIDRHLVDAQTHVRDHLSSPEKQQRFCARNSDVLHLQYGVITLTASTSGERHMVDDIAPLQPLENDRSQLVIDDDSYEHSADSSAEEDASVLSDDLPVSSIGIGEVMSLYPTNGRIRDVFTGEIIQLTANALKERREDSLHEHFQVGDFVEFDSAERPNAVKLKTGVTEIQKIQTNDVECVNDIVKCLREVESMAFDALLVYLNDPTAHNVSHPCSMKSLIELIMKYDIIFDESETTVLLKFQVSEDSAEWILPGRFVHTISPSPGSANSNQELKSDLTLTDDMVEKCRNLCELLSQQPMPESGVITSQATVMFTSTTVALATDEKPDVMIVIPHEAFAANARDVLSQVSNVTQMVKCGDEVVVRALPLPTNACGKEVCVALSVESIVPKQQDTGETNLASAAIGCGNDASASAAGISTEDSNGHQSTDINECAIESGQMIPTEEFNGDIEDIDDINEWSVTSEERDPSEEKVFVPYITNELLNQYFTASREASGHQEVDTSKHDETDPMASNDSCSAMNAEEAPSVLSKTADDVQPVSTSRTNVEHVSQMPSLTFPKYHEKDSIASRGMLPALPSTANDQPNVESELEVSSIQQHTQTISPVKAQVQPPVPVETQTQPNNQPLVPVVPHTMPNVQPSTPVVLPDQLHVQPAIPVTLLPVLPNVLPAVSHVQPNVHPEMAASATLPTLEPSRGTPADENNSEWQNHVIHRTVLFSRHATEGYGTVCAVLPPLVMVHMDHTCNVGVFTMATERSAVPKLDERVRYLAQSGDGRHVRWTITDLFFEHHIISALGSSIECDLVDVEVQTSVSGDMPGYHL